ncbi:MAG: TetR/AcrR family transcriptional regulator [Treponematales bacterium]
MTGETDMKESRKTRYTRRVIRESLIELMENKPITRISIKEICALADVSRPTFYAHYRDQYDLLQSIEDETHAFFMEANFIKTAKKLNKREMTAFVAGVLEYIERNSHSIQVLLSENGNPAFQRKIFRGFTEYIQHAMKNFSEKEAVSVKAAYYSVFTANGLVSLVQYWLKNKMALPTQELAAMIVELVAAIC